MKKNVYGFLKDAQFILLLAILLLPALPGNLFSGEQKKISEFVNPFIGTGGHGHTYPGATMPFGMMQLSPDTRLSGWDGCSGYHYSDSVIYGFSHMHLSGTGVSDYGDILLMPTNNVQFNNGADGNPGYASKFKHENEMAIPGYYQVFLDDCKTNVELTTATRSGMHRYQFDKEKAQFVILDLAHRDRLLDYQINIDSPTEVSGYRFSKAWANDQRVFFYIKFSRPIFKSEQFLRPEDGKAVKAAFQFDEKAGEILEIKIGISAVDIAGAKNNLQIEIGAKTFDQVKNEAERAWQKQLAKIYIESADDDLKTIFYTALYHSMLAPNIYHDVDGRYRGMDLEIHQTNDFTNYTVFSLWDTYRATHPLFTLIEQQRTNDFIRTMIHKYEQGGIIPIWDLSACYTGCMIGYHGVSVIADAFIKGIRDYNIEKAYAAMKHSAMQDHLGLAAYKKYGFIPMEEESESVSKTLEYAYDDWAIAQVAKDLNKKDDYKYFIQRAQNYKNVLDPASKFMRARFRNTWFSPFDPFEVNFNYTEANSWQYSFYVPQDISGFIRALGGKKILETQLDSLFTVSPKTSGRTQVDITGLIGQYAHGNEPSHHIAYLYNFVNRPDKTQAMVHQILTGLYQNAPDGISGNEDCGQMSSWYVLSAMGFYPVTPGSQDYIIGTPLFPRARINLENGNQLIIRANNVSSDNKYIRSAKLNGQTYPFSFIRHRDIMNGGELVFEMSDRPGSWAVADAHLPVSSIEAPLIVPAPYIAAGNPAFQDSTTIILKNPQAGAAIYYALNGEDFKLFSGPFSIFEAADLKFYAEIGERRSSVLHTKFSKVDPGLSIQLETEYSNQYNGGGNNALIDGMLGSKDFRTGSWQGYHNKDVVAVIDFGRVRQIQSVGSRYLRDQRSWIFYPVSVKYEVSEDGRTFQLVGEKKINSAVENEIVEIMTVTEIFAETPARYLKVTAKTLGRLPKWHIGYPMGGHSHIFIDEIQINE